MKLTESRLRQIIREEILQELDVPKPDELGRAALDVENKTFGVPELWGDRIEKDVVDQMRTRQQARVSLKNIWRDQNTMKNDGTHEGYEKWAAEDHRERNPHKGPGQPPGSWGDEIKLNLGLSGSVKAQQRYLTHLARFVNEIFKKLEDLGYSIDRRGDHRYEGGIISNDPDTEWTAVFPEEIETSSFRDRLSSGEPPRKKFTYPS